MTTRPLLALAAVALVPAAVIAIDSNLLGDFNVTNTFAAGTPARASQVNQNFADVTGALLTLDDRLSQVAVSANVIDVATSGALFSSIATAVASIDDSSASNPYIVRVAPGIYDESQQTRVPSFVRLEGAGAGVTILQINLNGSFALGAAVILADDVVISGLTVHNTSNSGNAIGISATGVSSRTALEDVEVLVDGPGGNAHTAVANSEGDLAIRRSRLLASGASTLNAGFTSNDTSGAFSQPVITDSEIEGLGTASGYALFIASTAAEIRNSRIIGDFRALRANSAGISRLHHTSVRTRNLNSVYEVSAGAVILSAGVGFAGGNALGLAASLKYVHCYNANLNPVVNGTGSSVQ
ncbi:MAG: pectin methylesterase-like acyl-CoA thioesterase [Planctomycetota bacterium]|jgi:pectin methylesterase-like acyl-CoA thioesterase